MKIGPVTKLDTRNTAKSKKFDDDGMSANFYLIKTENRTKKYLTRL